MKTNIMEKVTNFVEEKVSPTLGAFTDLPFVSAVAKAFNDLMPIMMIGSFAALFTAFSPTWYKEFITNTGISAALTVVYNLTINLTSLWFIFSLSYEYATRLGLKKQAFVTIFVSALAFLMSVRYTTIESTNYIAFTDLGSRGMFTAMVVGALTVRVYKLCIDRKIYIKMPSSVPAYIQNSFAGIIPGVFMAIIMSVIHGLVQMIGYDNFTSVVYAIVSKPLSYLTGNNVLMIILMTIPGILFFFGIHGSNATAAIIQPITIPLAIENIAAYAAGEPVTNIFAAGITGLLQINTFAACIVCLMSKMERFRSLGKMTFVTSIFSVGEPLGYGIPLNLNPYMFIPMVGSSLLDYILTVTLMSLNILPKTHAMYVWGLPILVSGFTYCGIAGVIWQIILVVLHIIIYTPFFRAYEKKCMADELAGNAE